MSNSQVRVGLGVIIENAAGEILVGKRCGEHAPFYSIPGGGLDVGESFEAAAIREIAEETNLTIEKPNVIAVTNNLATYRDEGRHTISVLLHTRLYHGEVTLMEPEKCSEWLWVNPCNLPEPHYEASRAGVELFLAHQFYQAG